MLNLLRSIFILISNVMTARNTMKQMKATAGRKPITRKPVGKRINNVVTTLERWVIYAVGGIVGLYALLLCLEWLIIG